MKVLITGGTGLLGKSLIETSNGRHEIMATYKGAYSIASGERVRYERLDVQNKEGYRALFLRFVPDVVIHTASVGNPDYAQRHKEETRKIDIDGTHNILSLCEQFGSKFIYISSNAIYDGEKAPYSEDDIPHPINYYGEIKLEGERLTKSASVAYSIVRPILMYGWNYPFERSNIITIALQKLEKNETIDVYNDVFCNPILANYCAEAIWEIIDNDIYDIFNIGGRDTVSIYQLVKTAAEIFGLDINLVRPVQQGFFKEMVKRPKDTSYKTTKMEKVLGIQPLSIKEGLEIMKAKTGKELCQSR